MHHTLKCWPEPFERIVRGIKRHEVRKADRAFLPGDQLTLKEWDPKTETYTGRSSGWVIGHVTTGGEWGLPTDLCVFSLLVDGFPLRQQSGGGHSDG